MGKVEAVNFRMRKVQLGNFQMGKVQLDNFQMGKVQINFKWEILKWRMAQFRNLGI